MHAEATICLRCGSDTAPLEVEFIGAVGTPTEVARLDAWVLCPNCGQRLNAQPDLNQKATIGFIAPVTAK
jgi:hypothetical protein